MSCRTIKPTYLKQEEKIFLALPTFSWHPVFTDWGHYLTIMDMRFYGAPVLATPIKFNPVKSRVYA